jgi:hypothetical protein
MKTKIKILFNQLKLPEMLIIIAILKIISLIIHLLVILFKIYNFNSKFINKIYNNNKLTRYNNKALEPKIKYPLLNKLNKKLLLNKINNLSSTKIILIILHLVTLLINKIHFIKILIISNSKIKSTLKPLKTLPKVSNKKKEASKDLKHSLNPPIDKELFAPSNKFV